MQISHVMRPPPVNTLTLSSSPTSPPKHRRWSSRSCPRSRSPLLACRWQWRASHDPPQLLGVTRAAAIRFIAKAYVRAARSLIFIFDGPIVIYGPAVLLLPSNFFIPWLLCSRYAAGRRCHFIAAWFAPSPPTIPVKCKYARPLFNFASSAYVSLDSFLYP